MLKTLWGMGLFSALAMASPAAGRQAYSDIQEEYASGLREQAERAKPRMDAAEAKRERRRERNRRLADRAVA